MTEVRRPHALKNLHFKSFQGEINIENAQYKLFLIDRYGIKKNDVLGKFIFQEKMHDTVENAP